MFGQTAIQLLLDLKRTQTVPPFNEEVVRAVTEEIQQLDAEIAKSLAHIQAQADNDGDDDDEQDQRFTAASLMVQHTALQRNKRIVLSYLRERQHRLKRCAWEVGYIPDGLKSNLHVSEVAFFDAYTQLLRSYNKHYDKQHFTLDVATDLQQPPNDLFVEVRVLKDIGEVYTEEGVVNLTPGTQHTLRRVVAETFIRQGSVEHKLG